MMLKDIIFKMLEDEGLQVDRALVTKTIRDGFLTQNGYRASFLRLCDAIDFSPSLFADRVSEKLISATPFEEYNRDFDSLLEKEGTYHTNRLNPLKLSKLKELFNKFILISDNEAFNIPFNLKISIGYLVEQIDFLSIIEQLVEDTPNENDINKELLQLFIDKAYKANKLVLNRSVVLFLHQNNCSIVNTKKRSWHKEYLPEYELKKVALVNKNLIFELISKREKDALWSVFFQNNMFEHRLLSYFDTNEVPNELHEMAFIEYLESKYIIKKIFDLDKALASYEQRVALSDSSGRVKFLVGAIWSLIRRYEIGLVIEINEILRRSNPEVVAAIEKEIAEKYSQILFFNKKACCISIVDDELSAFLEGSKRNHDKITPEWADKKDRNINENHFETVSCGLKYSNHWHSGNRAYDQENVLYAKDYIEYKNGLYLKHAFHKYDEKKVADERHNGFILLDDGYLRVLDELMQRGRYFDVVSDAIYYAPRTKGVLQIGALVETVATSLYFIEDEDLAKVSTEALKDLALFICLNYQLFKDLSIYGTEGAVEYILETLAIKLEKVLQMSLSKSGIKEIMFTLDCLPYVMITAVLVSVRSKSRLRFDSINLFSLPECECQDKSHLLDNLTLINKFSAGVSGLIRKDVQRYEPMIPSSIIMLPEVNEGIYQSNTKEIEQLTSKFKPTSEIVNDAIFKGISSHRAKDASDVILYMRKYLRSYNKEIGMAKEIKSNDGVIIFGDKAIVYSDFTWFGLMRFIYQYQLEHGMLIGEIQIVNLNYVTESLDVLHIPIPASINENMILNGFLYGKEWFDVTEKDFLFY